MPEIIMYDTGNGNRLYIPAIVCHLPSTNSIARIKPAYVTETDTIPSNALKVKYTSNESAKKSAKPEGGKIH